MFQIEWMMKHSSAYAQCWFSALSSFLFTSFSPSSSSDIISLSRFNIYFCKYCFFQKLVSNHDPSLIVRILLYGMLLFIPVLSVNIVNVSVKLLLSWNTIVGYSCFRFTALWNMLSKCINGGNRPKPVLLVRWALFVSGLHRVGAAVLARLRPHLSLPHECLTSSMIG